MPEPLWIWVSMSLNGSCFSEAKAQMWRKTVVIADRWYPSSKLCSNCGEKLKSLELSDRDWECPHCHTVHDRDANAAINLRKLYFDNLDVANHATQHT